MKVRECLDMDVSEFFKLAPVRTLPSPTGSGTGRMTEDVVEPPAPGPRRGVDFWCGGDLFWSKDRATLQEEFGLTHEAVKKTMDEETAAGIPEEKLTQYWPKSVLFPSGRVVKPE